MCHLDKTHHSFLEVRLIRRAILHRISEVVVTYEWQTG